MLDCRERVERAQWAQRTSCTTLQSLDRSVLLRKRQTTDHLVQRACMSGVCVDIGSKISEGGNTCIVLSYDHQPALPGRKAGYPQGSSVI
jgi:hypothetical protein